MFGAMNVVGGTGANRVIVTSLNDGEAQNMGCEEVIEHDLRYDRADEFMEVVLGHWDSWDDGAILNDKVNARYADPTKVKVMVETGYRLFLIDAPAAKAAQVARALEDLERAVKLGPGDSVRVAITEGLAEGERVITEGTLKARSGQAATVIQQPAAARDGSP